MELQAGEGGDDCESVEECVGGVTGFFGDIFGERTCAEVEVPCPGKQYNCICVAPPRKLKRNGVSVGLFRVDFLP